ncbi:MAG TPA: galactokinase [Terriglobales bacterium]|nr:galactokinase [Terriglobales bacterium]
MVESATPAPKAAIAEGLRREFEVRFKSQPRIFRAPGRVNLIGEHTDYNDGWVMPAAIEFGTWAAVAPRSDGTLHIVSLNFNEERVVSPEGAERRGDWSDYVSGVAVMLRRAGLGTADANLVLWGDVPLGAGLSSSASVEISAGLALVAAGGQQLSRRELARLCQRAENDFVGARCGIMDQFISSHGRAGHALLLDCRSLEYELIPLPADVAIVIANSMVKHELAAGEYNARRAECEEGVLILQRSLPGIRALRDVSLQQLEQHRGDLPPKIYRRCRHVVSENARVLEFARALKAGELRRAGELMAESHASLRDDYEVSCRELDLLVSFASEAGAIGSRMTGGGFGGCVVNLVAQADAERFQSELARNYEQATGMKPELYRTRAADGAHEVTARSEKNA